MTPTSTDVTGSGGVADPADLSAAAAPPTADSAAPEPEPPRKKRGGGPRTAAGRAASARNAIREGLRSKKLLPPDLEALAAERLKSLRETYRPTDQGEEDQLLIMARCGAQLEKVWADKLLDFVRIRDRAKHAWDDDRNVHVDVLVGRLEKDCSRAVRALRRSKQGVEYLLNQFDELGLLVEGQDRLTESQRERLFMLVGIPVELREGNTRVPLATDSSALLDFIESQVKELVDRLEDSLLRSDAFERQCALDGYALEADHKTRQIRKYEADLIRERNRALAELLRIRAERGRPAPAAAPASTAPGPAPGPQPSPPPEPPDLPPRPVQSEADAWHMLKMSVETATDLTVLACEAARRAESEAAAAAEVEVASVVTSHAAPAAAAADPVIASASGPASAAPAPAAPKPAPARPATASPLPAADAERKRREDAERKRQRDRQKKARKKGRSNKR